ncbi:MAG: mechanosensitive ion channel family protein, partial [Pseudomonadota bacterium]
LRMRFRTAPEMQWDVARAFNLLLKQRMEEQVIDLGVPRLSVNMEARSEPSNDAQKDEKAAGDTALSRPQAHTQGDPRGESRTSANPEGGNE